LYGLLRISTDEPDSLLELAGFLPHQEIEKRMKKSLRVCRLRITGPIRIIRPIRTIR
jgi:hypothetical protein